MVCAVRLLGAEPATDNSAAWQSSLQSERAGNYAGAVAALEPLGTAYVAEVRRGWLYYLDRHYPESLQHYRAAVAAKPQSLDGRLGITLPLLALGRYGEAEDWARQVLREQPGNYRAALRLASALEAQEKYEEAEKVLTAALAQYPSDTALLVELGRVDLALHRPGAARRVFSKVVTLDPDNQEAAARLMELDETTRSQVALLDLGAATSGPGLNALWEPAAVGGVSAAGTQATATVLGYYAYADYHDTLSKDYAHLAGAYGLVDLGAKQTLEGEIDFSDVHYRGASSIRQWDTTLVFGNVGIPHWRFRYGGHYIFSDDRPTDHGWSLLGGVHYYEAARWEAGLDAGFSQFPHYGDGLEVGQVSPMASVVLWQGPVAGLREDARGYWIHSDQELFGQKNFFSLEDALTFSWRQWAFSGFGWLGKQVFALRNSGFTLLNLTEEHTAGYGLEVRREFGPHATGILRYSREEFREVGASSKASGNFYFVGGSFTF